MSKKSKKFWRLMGQCVWEAFLNTNGKDEERALSSLLSYAKLQIPAEEHDVLEQMPKWRLINLVAKIFAENPDSFGKHLDEDKKINDLLSQLPILDE